MKKGIFVTLCAGNYGPDPSTILNDVPWALSVTAGSVDRWSSGTLRLGNGVISIVGWPLYPEKASVENMPLLFDDAAMSKCDSRI